MENKSVLSNDNAGLAGAPSIALGSNESDLYQQQFYVRVLFCLQQSNVGSSSTTTSERMIQHTDVNLMLGTGALPCPMVGDHKDLWRGTNWAVTKPFYDKTFFYNGDPRGETTKRISVRHTFKPTDIIQYSNANAAATHEYLGSPAQCNPDNLGIVMYVITRYANDDYPTFLAGLAGSAGIVGGVSGAAPDLEIMGESEFRFKDA
jgi:hypothetical protein